MCSCPCVAAGYLDDVAVPARAPLIYKFVLTESTVPQSLVSETDSPPVEATVVSAAMESVPIKFRFVVPEAFMNLTPVLLSPARVSRNIHLFAPVETVDTTLETAKHENGTPVDGVFPVGEKLRTSAALATLAEVVLMTDEAKVPASNWSLSM